MPYITTKKKVKDEKGENPVPTLHTKLNPLRSQNTCKWFKSRGSNNHEYYHSIIEKQQLSELEKLFGKFDLDGSGTLDMEEILELFATANIKISSKTIRKIFKGAKE
jgi:hypothetical protein